jgi:hypothetical protein
MPITVACSCGRKLAAKDEYAGRTVKCPGCGKPLKIPGAGGATSVESADRGGRNDPAKKKKAASAASRSASSASQLLDEAGLGHYVEGPTCPECGGSVPEEAVLCVQCGYNFKLRRRLHSQGKPLPLSKFKAPGAKQEPEKHASDADKVLAKAAKDLENEPVEQDQGYGTKWSAWVLTLIMLAGMAAFIAGGIALVNYVEGRAAQSRDSEQNY